MKPFLFSTCGGCPFSPKSLNDPPCSHPKCAQKLALETEFPTNCHFYVSANPYGGLQPPKIESDPFDDALVNTWKQTFPAAYSLEANVKGLGNSYNATGAWDRQIQTEAKKQVSAALKEILTTEGDALNIISNLADIRRGLVAEVNKFKDNTEGDPFSSYNEGFQDALQSVLDALDKKLDGVGK